MKDHTEMSARAWDRQTYLDMLPVELLHMVWAHLWAHEILLSFSQMNDVLDAKLFNYRTYAINTRYLDRTVMNRLQTYVKPDHIGFLILNFHGNCLLHATMFLSFYQLSNLKFLKSLYLNHMSYRNIMQLMLGLFQLERIQLLSFTLPNKGD